MASLFSRIRYHWMVPILLLGALGCYTVPGTGRSALNLMSPGQEAQLGLNAFQDIKKKEKISDNKEQNAMVQRVGERIVSVAKADIPDTNWEFVLFENKTPNAFALPGGKVGVYTGLLEITQNDAGLATVLSHEIGHVAARHGAERMSQQLMVTGAAVGLAVGLSHEKSSTRNSAMLAFGLASTLGYALPYSRIHEAEADHIGLIYMAKAGYDPNEAIAFWKRFKAFNEKKGGKPPEFLSTHPTDETRIHNLEALLPEAQVYYQTSGRN